MSKKNERIRGREKARIARKLKTTDLAIAYHEAMERIGMRWSLRMGSSMGAPSLPTKHTLSKGRERMS